MAHRLDITKRLHERLLEIVRTALPLIPSVKADADLIGLAHLRSEMVEAMNAYCRHVHELHGDAAATAEPSRLLTARTLIEGCSSLHASYEVFRERWEHRAALDNWYEYRLSAVVMMKQVRDQVRQTESLFQDDRLKAA